MKKILGYLIAITILVAPLVCYAEQPSEPPTGGNSGGSTTATYSGATTFATSDSQESKTYSSSTGGQNALLVSGGTSSITSCTIDKLGDSSDENADFYGTNAAILVYNNGTLNINGGTITTNAGHANAVFAYGTGTININDTTITTKSNNSGGIMVTGGGTLTATNLTVTTDGNSSASIRSDRGGGTLTVYKGTYTTNGTGSPAIYSTAAITVNDATLTATKSEGVVIEGGNSVKLNNVNLTDSNTTLNGNSETYKNIFIYQSMSGDATEGSAEFDATNSNITTNNGDTIFVTNTTCTINLNSNTITNNTGDFLRIQSGKWGNSGSNGGNVTLNLANQTAVGDIVVDNVSTLAMSMSAGSVYEGAIDNANQAKKVTLSLDSDTIFVLSNDSYVDTLTNGTTDNSNIYLNGHKLYVNGSEVSANTGVYNGQSSLTSTTTKTTSTNNNALYIGIAIAILVIILLIVFIIKMAKKKKNTTK